MQSINNQVDKLGKKCNQIEIVWEVHKELITDVGTEK